MMTKTAPSPGPRILSVGQCGFDHRSITDLLAKPLGAAVESAHDLDDSRRAIRDHGPFHLVLVNRLLDQDGSSGLDVIRAIMQDPDLGASGAAIMLVSDYPDAQSQAVEMGAALGFGKSEMHLPETLRRIRSLLAR